MGMQTKCRVCSWLIADSCREPDLFICPNCGSYLPYPSGQRIEALADPGSIQPLSFQDDYYETGAEEKYRDDIQALREQSGLHEAITCAEIRMDGLPLLLGVMDSRFLMASMGHAVGESVCRLFHYALEKRLPVVLFCASGGARMQEGIIALMQMEKTAAAVRAHHEAGLLYISVLTDPTMGGVTASFASLADVILAEKGAMIGFAGARVIRQNTGETLPEGFQSAEFQKEHGFVDAVVPREELRKTLAFLLDIHRPAGSMEPLPRSAEEAPPLPRQTAARSPWEQVNLARSRNRPAGLDYIGALFTDFYELGGDRVAGDDHAVVAGIARFRGLPVTVIGQQKGKKDIHDACYRNFGMPSPAGYRKALRLAKQAEKFRRPVIFFVDTIGAACGAEAEAQGQGRAIAEMLYEMSGLRVPVYSLIIGEGGSGGALAFAVGNRVCMLENAVYSVITPEGYASILWKDSSRAEEAAAAMHMTAAELYSQHIVDEVIPEPEPVTRENMEPVCQAITRSLYRFFREYADEPDASRQRVARFSRF